MISRAVGDAPRRIPFWLSDARLPEHPPLERDASVDACVIGAGIAGLTTAYLLAREGRSVIVVDDGPVAGGMSSHTSAHLTCALDDRFTEVARIRGEDVARIAAQAHSRAIDQVQDIVRNERIDCSFTRVDGWLFLNAQENEKDLDDELAAAHRAGLTAVEKQPRVPGLPFETGPCLRFPRQGQFHPVKYLAGLAHAIEARGGRVHCATKALDVKDGNPCSVTTTRGVVTAPMVIVATNIPIVGRVAIPIREAAYMTYVVGARIRKGTVKPALYWDTGFPYHYIRTSPIEGSDDEEMLVVGGEDHRSGQEDDPFAHHERVETWMRGRFPGLGAIEYAWSGQIVETMDGLAYIGRHPGHEHVLVASGDSGMGLTHGTIAGIVLTDIACGRANPWEKAFDPSRFPLKGAPEVVRENLKTNAQYADWLRGGDAKSESEVPAGGGAVLVEHGHRVACYRDAGGEVHRMSAICPHMGCVVRWNPDATTWDCPCHGSRFDRHGVVINGPANADLGPAHEAAKKEEEA
jgi:glycine/D-amino acid oxidase-like deaminating enzyme/nitrite reductase/ring-hydroxylating ferredoxin subunit